MKKINLAIGIHNHQPVGNFDFVFEEAYQKSYLPFLSVLEKFPEIKLAQHYTGILLQWIKENHPEFLPRLRKLADSGQIEMMTGGFYEPILAAICDEDKIGQIKKLTQFVKQETGYDPVGAWVAERVWEPNLPEPLANAGIQYTVIDDAHFKYAGLQEQQLRGYFLSENNGRVVKIFPISEKLRYTMPFMPPEATIDFLATLADEDGKRLVVFADDGEKFGVWPKTYEQCYERGWVENFFRLLVENRAWINLITFSEALVALPPAGRVYLPTASYREMMEWALPTQSIMQYEDFEHWLHDQQMADEHKVFVRGGFWRNFMVKYPESNNLHKRMSRSAERLRTINSKKTKELAEAQNHVFAGQCNCPYWHGVFGGLYLPNLRFPIYRNLIQADVIMDRLQHTAEETKQGWVQSEISDFDKDGFDEVMLESDCLGLFFNPQMGGALFELDLKSHAINLLDTMTRREEAYHRKLRQAVQQKDKPAESQVSSIHDLVLMKEEHLEQHLNYDWYRRSSLLDHFLRDDATLDSFGRAQYGEQGDFVNQPYQTRIVKKGRNLQLLMQRDGHVWVGADWAPVRVLKTVNLRGLENGLQVHYRITNLHDRPISVWFGTESVFALMAGDAPDRYFSSPGIEIEDAKLASVGELSPITEVSLNDEWLNLSCRLISNQPAAFWRFPIETVSLSEAGFERVYQGSVVMPNWHIALPPGETWETQLQFVFESLT